MPSSSTTSLTNTSTPSSFGVTRAVIMVFSMLSVLSSCTTSDSDSRRASLASSCDPGHVAVASPTDCLQDDAVCYEIEGSGTENWCTGESCGTCEDGDIAVDSEADCLQDSAICYATSSCGIEIWCTAPTSCEATCAEGETEIPDSSACLQDDATCYSLDDCGTEIWCTGPA